MQILRRQQQVLLAKAQDNSTAAAAASNLIRESVHQMAGVRDAVSEQSIIGTNPPVPVSVNGVVTIAHH